MHTNLLSRPRILTGVAAVLSVLASLLASPLAHGATTTTPATGQALEIGPPVVNLVTDPGKKLTTTLSLRDISSSSLVVTNEIDDFTAAGEDGTPKVILDPTEANPYSLKTWIAPIPSINLKSRDLKSVPVTINVPANAAPGGYYGIIRFTGTPPNLNGDSGVSLNASLGALVFIRVNGAASESMNIEEFSSNNGGATKTFFETAPVSFVVRLKNTGNVYEQPTGLVTVKDMFGHTTATLLINADQHTILSNTIRKFEASMDSSVLGSRMLFGKYSAHLDVNYGTANTKISKDFTFWVIPWKLITFGVLAIAAVVIGLFFLVRRYNRMIVKRAQRRK